MTKVPAAGAARLERPSRCARCVLRVCVAAALLIAPRAAIAQVLSGSYTGDGTDARAFTGLGFRPDVLIIKANAAQVGVIRTSTMNGDASKPMTGGTALTANLIESLDPAGFTVGSDARVNANGTEYYWIAFKAGAKRLEVGTYTGNGGNPRTIGGLGFSPDFMVVLSAGTGEAVWRSTADTEAFNFATSAGGTWLGALGPSSFIVTNDARVNANGTAYHYIAWNEVAGVMDVGTYDGNGDDPRTVAVGFEPEYVFVKQDGGISAVHHPASVGAAVDDTLYFTATANAANRIQALVEGGFEVGGNSETNQNSRTYNYVAWRRVVKQTEVLSGSYVGDGTDNRQITGLGFSPDLVIVKGETAQNAVLRSYASTGDLSKDLIDGTIGADRIQSLDPEGFTIGTDARVNSTGVTYHWVAWVAGAGEMTVGTYSGTGAAGRAITDLGFSPDIVIVAGTNLEGVYRNSAATAAFSFGTTRSTTWITSMDADGFTVGSDARVNAAGGSYSFVAWNEIPGQMEVGTYTGDGNDDRGVTGIGFQPELALAQRDASGFSALMHPASIGVSTDATLFFDGQAAVANYIQALQADGFQVGSQSNINASGGTYAYAAWKRPTLTAVRMGLTKARRTEKGVVLTWRTGFEVDNLGFEIYRERAGERARVTPKAIAGSALFVPQGIPLTAGRSYTWTDDSPEALQDGVTYWIQDIDLNGTRTWHGPIEAAGSRRPRDRSGDAETPAPPAQPRDRLPVSDEDPSSEPAAVPVNSQLLNELTRSRTVVPDAVPEPQDASGVPVRTTVRPEGPAFVGSIAVPSPVVPRHAASSPPPLSLASHPGATEGTASLPRSSATTPVQPEASETRPAEEARAIATQLTAASSPVAAASAAATPPASAAAPSMPPTVPVNPRITRTPLVTSIAGTLKPGTPADVQAQWATASAAAARILVRSAGWYRVTQPALVAAGIDAAGDPRHLKLTVNGVEQPMLVTGESDGHFDPADAIEFYGTGVDTPYTDARVYWITLGGSPGTRLPAIDASASGTPAGLSFTHTVERKDREVFFGGLLNGDEENFFGPLVVEGSLTTQELTLPHVYAGGSQATLEVALQGVTALPASPDHRVGVLLNGTEIGELIFDGRTAGAASLSVPHALLTTGVNTVALEARGGADDLTLVRHVRLTYEREYRADGNQLALPADAGQELTVAGFGSSSIRVFDVTGGSAAQELLGTAAADGGAWSVTFTVAGSGARELFLTTVDAVASPWAVQANAPSSLHAAGQSGEIVMITHRDFASALVPLRSLRESQNYTVQVVDVQDVYDEFSFGEKTPDAIRAFLVRAAETWAKPPRFVLLTGNATNDPRDYHGIGEPDYVPTRIVPTGVLETASDDWFADADGDGFAELGAVGRLPARTLAEATTMVDKIVGYERSSPESWHNSVLLVSDQGDTDPSEFSALNDAVGSLLPAGYAVTHLQRGEDANAAQTLRAKLSDGAVLMNYMGHGSVELLRGNLLTTADAATLDNGSRLPLVVTMTCFSGFFHGLFPEESLGEALLRAPNGGAIGVWASSGMTDARWQSSMDRELVRQMFRGSWVSVGEAIRAAKRNVGNQDVRRTWIFFGDPALRLKGLARSPAERAGGTTPVATPPQNDGDPPPAEGEDPARSAPRRAVRLADFDGDGRGDALVAEAASGSWLSLIGAPGNLVHTQGQFAVAGEPLALRLNGDSRADVFVYNPRTGEWLQGMSEGDGQFVVSTGTWRAGLAVVAGDFDGNGRDDLFAHHADGTWLQAFPDGQGYYSYRHGTGVASGQAHTGDFDGDGRTDVFIYNAVTGRWTIAFSTASYPNLRNGGWTAGWQPLVANLNGDAAADIVLWHPDSGSWVQCIRDAAQTFVYHSGVLPAGGRLHAIDLTDDGRDELFRYDWKTGDWTLAVLTAPGEVQQADGLWEVGWEMASGDLNGDGATDLLLYNPDTGEWTRRLSLDSGWVDDVSGLWPRNWKIAGRQR